VTTVVFDVGETLVDETRVWAEAADALGVPQFTLFGIVGGLAARGESHKRVWEILGVPARRGGGFEARDLYPDARPCVAALRARGYRVALAGNGSRDAYARLDLDADLIASSAAWGVEKPAPEFFERVVSECGCAPGQIAYVGDRVDNDVLPARAAGMRAVHLRRGPWGHLHAAPGDAPTIGSLDLLPELLDA
jgi:HAD superfamily hydrolase (TIGR01509 family)